MKELTMPEAEAADYIYKLANDLAKIAKTQRLHFAAALLEMASDAAWEASTSRMVLKTTLEAQNEAKLTETLEKARTIVDRKTA